MSDWSGWLIVAGALVVLELFSATFYLLMFAIGLAAGALAAFVGAPFAVQMIAAALVGTIATLSLRRSRFGMRNKVAATRDPNVNLDIGQSIQVKQWHGPAGGKGKYSARSMHRGANWDVEYAGADQPQPGLFTIVEIRGSQLIVDSSGP